MTAPRFTIAELAATAAGRLPSNQAVLGTGGKPGRTREPKTVALPPSRFDGSTGTCTIVLPLPAPALRPNGRPGKWGRIKAITAAREEAAQTACVALRGCRPLWAGADVTLHVYLTSRRQSDDLNWISACKAYEDGICADAGLVANDSGNRWGAVVVDKDRTCPRVEIVFTRRG